MPVDIGGDVCFIDATPGGSSANAFCTIPEADAYHATARLADADWTNGSEDQKCRAIVWATRLLDEQIKWRGKIATDTQALGWPRSGATDIFDREIASDIIPQSVKYATAELARYLIESDLTAPLSSEGIKKLRVANIDVEFSEANPPTRKTIPDAVLEMLAPLIVENRFGTSATMKLLRV